MTNGSSVLSTVLVLISRFLGFHFKDKSPVDPILKAGELLCKVHDVLVDAWFVHYNEVDYISEIVKSYHGESTGTNV